MQHLFSAESETKAWRVATPYLFSIHPAPSKTGTRSAGPAPRPGRSSPRPREGQGLPEATQSRAVSALLLGPPEPPPRAAGSVTRPQKHGKEGKGEGRPPRCTPPRHRVCCGLPLALSTVWPQMASGAGPSPAYGPAHVAPGVPPWLARPPPHTPRPNQAGLPGRREEALAWLLEKPRICSKCKQRVILSRPPPSQGVLTHLTLEGPEGGARVRMWVFLTLFFTSLVPPEFA